MPVAAEDDKGSTQPIEQADEDAKLAEPTSAVTREKHDAAKPDPPEADEFGLPVRPGRRREYSLDQLDSPEDIKKQVIEQIKGKREDVGASNGRNEEPASSIEASNDEERQPQDSKSRSLESDAPATPRTSVDGRGLVGKTPDAANSPASPTLLTSPISPRHGKAAVSEWSHQQIVPREEEEEKKPAEEEWQEMPAFSTHTVYDDWGKVLAKEYDEMEDEKVAYGTLGGAGKGYSKVQMDEDAQSATSMDENTAYLFGDTSKANILYEEDDDSRDMMSQMQLTKELLTESQRIAYVGLVRLSIAGMLVEHQKVDKSKHTKKHLDFVSEAFKMWGQKIMVRLYGHMEIGAAEQIMIEQLADHGVLAADLTPQLMANARVKNPNAESGPASGASSARPSVSSPRPSSAVGTRLASNNLSAPPTPPPPSPAAVPEPLPPSYEEHTADQLTIQDPAALQDGKDIDLDIRWTVLCDLFLLLIADSSYDARSRTLLERVASGMSVEWQELCRFEKRVTDALEMQEEAEKENWNEEGHLEARKKAARNKRLMVMGLCTVGGGLVIGLSAGLLAPVIGAGLAAGFTGIGIAGTGGFLGGTGAAALIGTGGTLIGGGIGLKTSNRRTGAVKTYEYKPLFDNKRVNLIVTVAGWMTGKVDDVRLPFSTIDPIMGDIYSVNWEPEMLQSTGQTIQILGTEALTQTIQQILGATFLATLMAGLSTPIVLAKISYLIDNPWTVSLARADLTGLILADSIIDRNLGVRPITLVGFSLGSRVIWACLRELAKRGAVGLIQNVYMFGSPVVVKTDEYARARSIVSGRFVNGYATNDWILGYLFRATSGGIMRIAGLASVDVHGIENIDVTENVPGHMAYRGMMPTLLEQVGWSVESLEFSEIEDPDPDNHEKRQRELINEIEEARRHMDEQPEKRGLKAFFSRKKAPQKKAWETYDERSARVREGDETESERMAEESGGVFFDVEAIRREALALALRNPNDLDEIKAHMSVREIETTLPALKVTTTQPMNGTTSGPSRPEIRQTQSYSGLPSGRQQNDESSEVPHTNGLTPSPHSNHEEAGDETKDRITMSFEVPERPPRWGSPSPSSFSPALSGVGSSSLSPHPSPGLSSHRASTDSWRVEQTGWGDKPRATTPRFGSSDERLAMRSVSTPVVSSSSTHLATSHVSDNEWADSRHENDADLGQRRHAGEEGEEEVEMSFE